MYRTINKYIERNLCFKLDNYQESLHDARSTKRNIELEATVIFVRKFVLNILQIVMKF